MAIRIEPDAALDFGVMVAAVTATHARFRDDSGANPVVKQLIAPVAVAAGERLIVPANMLDLIFPAGEFTNDFMSNVALQNFATKELQVDMMTDDSTIITDSGYSQQTQNAWTASQEAD